MEECVKKQDYEGLKKLLEMKVSKEAATEAFWQAFNNNDSTAVRMFIINNSELNFLQNTANEFPLLMAVKELNLEMVSALTSSKLREDLTDKICCIYNDFDASLLLRLSMMLAGQDMDKCLKTLNTHQWFSHAHSSMYERANGGAIDAVMPSEFECIDFLPNWGGEIEEENEDNNEIAEETSCNKDEKPETSNHLKKYGREEKIMLIIRILLEYGFSPNVDGLLTKLPLIVAVESGNMELVKLLVDFGARGDVCCRDHSVSSALHAAVYSEKIQSTGRNQSDMAVMKELFRIDIDVDPKNAFGETPLFHAVCHGRMDQFEYLLLKGANPDHQKNPRNEPGDIRYNRPLMVAIDKYDEIRGKMIEMLLDTGKVDLNHTYDGNSNLTLACCIRNPKVIEMLLKAGADINILDDLKQNCLYYMNPSTCDRDENQKALACINLMMDYGANINNRDDCNTTPLISSIEDQNLLAAKCFILRGCQLEAQNARGHTALSLCLRVHDVMSASCLFLLLEAGCNVTELQRTPDLTRKLAFVDAEHREKLLMNHILHPRTLRLQAAAVIRRYLGSRLQQDGKLLELPDSVQEFLLMQHLRNIHLCPNKWCDCGRLPTPPSSDNSDNEWGF